MHALIIADISFATRERAMLSRLEVGLADEGVRVTHAMPSSIHSVGTFNASEAIGIQSTVVNYQDRGLPFTHRRRAADLARAIEDRFDEPTPIDIVHAFGAGSWTIALDLARRTGAGLLLELWRPGLLTPATALCTAAARTHHPVTPEFIVSETPIAAELRKRIPTAKVYSAPWGVHAPNHLRGTRPAGQPLSIAMLCDTGDPKFCTPALAGLVQAAAGAEVLIFGAIDEESPSRDAALWSAVRKLNLLDRFSLVPDFESRREPILDMDMLILPEATGRQRTITLEAMGAGMTVLALADDMMETLADGTTARLVRPVGTPAPTPAAWAQAIAATALNPTAATDLARSAHEYVRSNRMGSTQIADVLRAYQQVSRPAPAGVD
jgi:hypothetical protein